MVVKVRKSSEMIKKNKIFLFNAQKYLSLQLIMNENMNRNKWLFAVLTLVVVAVGVWYYAQDDEDDDDEEVGEYVTMTIAEQDYTVTREFTAKIETEQPAAIRPQIAGRIVKICVNEGARVKKGQPLIVLDQVPYQAAVRSAEAKVNSAKAQLATARQNMEGKEALFNKKVIGDFDMNKARNEQAEAEAALNEARADLEAARNDYSYTVVKSPSDGVISMIQYRLGELVDPSMEKPLTIVSDSRRIHAYTAISEQTLYDLKQYYGCSAEELPSQLPDVTLITYWDKELEQKGHIDAISGEVDEVTGSVYIRASFDNSQGIFRNGSNGVLRMPYHLKDAIVIPQEATFEIQDRYFVSKVVDGVTRTTEIKVFPYNDGQTYAVISGLKPGDVIVAEGGGMVREGTAVKIKK